MTITPEKIIGWGKSSTRNTDRNSNYGKRIGDTVSFSALGITKHNGLVADYGYNDNNSVQVLWPGESEPVKEVAEWLTVTEKIEDKVKSVTSA